MEYLKVKCHRCGNGFHLYNRDMSHEEKPPHCPHCLVQMDKTQWERLIDAYYTMSEVNKDFRKYHQDRGEPLFQVELKNHYVKPEKIVLDDQIQKNLDILKDIVNHPVPNRNIEDYE